MEVCRAYTRLPVTGTLQKENEMPLQGGSLCTPTVFFHGTNIGLKHTIIPLILLGFYCSSEQVAFLIMNSSLKYGLHSAV